MKRAETPGRVWSLVERVSFWGLALLTLVVVGFLDRTPLIRMPLLADLIVLALWTVRVAVFGRRRVGRRAVGVMAGVVALLGGFGVVTGLWLDPLWSPTFTVAPVETDSIIDLSRFRSCAGHDYSGPAVGSPGQDETDRSMKHYVSLDVRYGDGVEVVVRAMADGVVSSVVTGAPADASAGSGDATLLDVGNVAGELTLTMSGFSQFGYWDLRYMHVVPTVAAGTRVRAGDPIGVLPPSDWAGVRNADGSLAFLPTHPIQFDLALGYHSLLPFGEQLDSFVHHLDPALALTLGDAGFTVEETVIARAERDAQPCEGVYNVEVDADWVFGDRARRAADEAAGIDEETVTTAPSDEFALRPTCTKAIVSTKWMADDGTLWTCVLDDAGVPTWRMD
ncbi:MAG: hypothetical protein ACO3AV_12825 [Ilumatobacteraceae bacterium]